MEPVVSVIIINFNGRDHVEDCLTSVLNDEQSPAFEVIVVDNASFDRSWEIVVQYASHQNSCTILRSESNLGYFGGVNFALPKAKGKYIAILNMDIIVSSGWLLSIINFFESHPKVGAVSPLILLEQDKKRINAIGQSVHVTGLGFNCGLGRPKKDVDLDPISVSGIHGGAFVIRRSILDQIGGLDESGFLYHEDVNISWLLQLMGYDLYCVPASVVRHDYILTMYPDKLFLLERNRLSMLLTHIDFITLLAIFPLLLFTEILMWGYSILRGFNFIIAKASSYRWLFKNRKIISTRKRFVNSIKIRNEWQMLKLLAWNYAWGQFLSLGREKGTSTRQHNVKLPIGTDLPLDD